MVDYDDLSDDRRERIAQLVDEYIETWFEAFKTNKRGDKINFDKSRLVGHINLELRKATEDMREDLIEAAEQAGWSPEDYQR